MAIYAVSSPYSTVYGHIWAHTALYCTVVTQYALYPPLIHTVATPDPLYPGMAVYTVYTPILCHIRYHTVHIRPTLYCTGIHPYTAYWPPLYTVVSRICPYMGHIAVYTGTWPTPNPGVCPYDPCMYPLPTPVLPPVHTLYYTLIHTVSVPTYTRYCILHTYRYYTYMCIHTYTVHCMCTDHTHYIR